MIVLAEKDPFHGTLRLDKSNEDDRKELDRQFKNEKSNFKIAIVVGVRSLKSEV